MKTYIKPAMELVKLTVEERFATAGSGCYLTGGCGWVDETGVYHEFKHWEGQNAPVA